MRLVKLHTKRPGYDRNSGKETLPEEWIEELVNLDLVERVYIKEVDECPTTTLFMNSGSILYLREPHDWVVKQFLGPAHIPEYDFSEKKDELDKISNVPSPGLSNGDQVVCFNEDPNKILANGKFIGMNRDGLFVVSFPCMETGVFNIYQHFKSVRKL